MGQKVNPIAMRLGYIKQANSRWFANKKDFSSYLHADVKVREFLMKKLEHASVSHIEIERPAKNAKVTIFSARPGTIIGKKGDQVEVLKQAIEKIVKMPTHLSVKEVKKPDLNAQLIADNMARQIEKRVMYRRVMKRSMQNVMRAGAEGVRIYMGGRLAGAEIARSESCRDGRVPLHTFRADIDYATARANTTYGVIGIKVWIFKGEIYDIESQKN